MVSSELYYAVSSALANEINSYFPKPTEIEIYKPTRLNSTLVVKCFFDPELFDEYTVYYYYFILHIGPTYNMPIIREYGVEGISEIEILPYTLPTKKAIPIPQSNQIRSLYYSEFSN